MKNQLFIILLVSTLFSSEAEVISRINAHLLIRDSRTAVAEAKASLREEASSRALRLALIRSLCQEGKEVEALEQWKEVVALFPGERSSRPLLEVLSWAVLNQGAYSSQVMIQLNSLIGASFTRDARAIQVLLHHMRSSSALLRSIAVRLATSLGDTPLQEELLRLLKEERVWHVRLEVIKGVGALKMLSAEQKLKEIISHPKTLSEEKAAAILSLAQMCEGLGPEPLEQLVRSERSGLRELACEIISYWGLKEQAFLLPALLKDSCPEVRLSALSALGLCDVQELKGKSVVEWAQPLLTDSSPPVAITAAWVLLIHKAPNAEKALQAWIQGPTAQWRRLASAALARSGKWGVESAFKTIESSADPYVRANCALALITQRKHLQKACDVLYAVFSEQGHVWMWDQKHPLFRSLAPSQVQHIDQIPDYPRVVDQVTRLDILSVLSMMHYPRAQELVRGFLKMRGFGVSTAAAASLLQEGGAEAFELVRGLLDDSDEKIRLQAALLLCVFTREPSAVQVLLKMYPQADREMKVHILEAVAHVGDPETIPFLMEVLGEPFQILRVVAASALIQCLYH